MTLTEEYLKAMVARCPVCLALPFTPCVSHRDSERPDRHEAHRLRVAEAAKIRLAFKKGEYNVK